MKGDWCHAGGKHHTWGMRVISVEIEKHKNFRVVPPVECTRSRGETPRTTDMITEIYAQL